MAIHSQIHFSASAGAGAGEIVAAGTLQRVFVISLGIAFLALLVAVAQYGQTTTRSALPEVPRAERIIKTVAFTSPHHAAKPKLADANSQFGQL